MRFSTVILLLILLFSGIDKVSAQAVDEPDYQPYRLDTLNKKRLNTLYALGGTAYVGSWTSLYFLWYAGYDQSRFHFIEDSYEWLQIDKLGHMTTTYQFSIFTYNMHRWAGQTKKKSLINSFLIGYSYQAFIEVFDGFSAGWGASLTDLGANTLGAAIFLSQQMAWDELKVKLKFSFHVDNYGGYNTSIQERVGKLYGKSLPEQLLKDYNSQTYWLSTPISNIYSHPKMPEWLCISVGYGAQNMLGANWNLWYSDGCFYDYKSLPRYRQFYLSLDVDFEKVKWKSKFYRTIAPYLNIVKFPFPAFEINTLGKAKVHGLYF